VDTETFRTGCMPSSWKGAFVADAEEQETAAADAENAEVTRLSVRTLETISLASKAAECSSESMMQLERAGVVTKKRREAMAVAPASGSTQTSSDPI
jgi:hypothetical protein